MQGWKEGYERSREEEGWKPPSTQSSGVVPIHLWLPAGFSQWEALMECQRAREKEVGLHVHVFLTATSKQRRDL